MSSYFEDFKKTISLVEKHVQDICFLVDIDYTYIQIVVPRIRWLRPLPYEIDVDEALAAITTLLVEDTNKEEKYFGTYDIVKSRVSTDLKIASSMRKKDKIIKKMKSQSGVGDDDEEDVEEANEEGPLAITQGLGEDTEGAKQEGEEEAEQTPPIEKKRKAKEPPKPRPQKKIAKLSPTKPNTRSAASIRASV